MKAAFLHPNLSHNSCPILALMHPLLMPTKVTLVSHGALGTSELYHCIRDGNALKPNTTPRAVHG